ncbi:hypothetical protein GW17_00058919, partial [Ensete ventricosum]
MWTTLGLDENTRPLSGRDYTKVFLTEHRRRPRVLFSRREEMERLPTRERIRGDVAGVAREPSPPAGENSRR